jgi:outer membrane protein TolC
VALRFTTPLDQVTERNVYREALIAYQRQRRAYMLQEDNVKQQIRVAWRQLTVQQERLAIDRETIRNVAREYDSASLSALGQGQGNALNVLNALNSVLQAQNTLIGNWVNYETNRLNIFRDMGIMQVNQQGLWSDRFYLEAGDGAGSDQAEMPSQIPPAVPEPEIPAVDAP